MNAYLITPGIADFEEIEIREPASEPGMINVRPFGSDAIFPVAASRIVDLETARRRNHLKIVEERDDMGRWTR